MTANCLPPLAGYEFCTGHVKKKLPVTSVKKLPVTTNFLSTLVGFETWLGHVKKLYGLPTVSHHWPGHVKKLLVT